MNKPKEGGFDYTFLLKENVEFDFDSATEEELTKYINDNFPDTFPDDRKKEIVQKILEERKKES